MLGDDRKRRDRMVACQIQARGIRDVRVIEAMCAVPREAFVPHHLAGLAYDDGPLPIGEGQTISQPYIVALMLQVLTLVPADRVLEVGTGSGYLTALLAELVAQVVSVERHAVLAESARMLLIGMGYSNASVIVGDGSLGYPQAAPYDAIIVSAAAPEVPSALLAQLREGGRMIIPVGSDDSQQLQLIRMENGEPKVALRELCRFVPLVSGNGE